MGKWMNLAVEQDADENSTNSTHPPVDPGILISRLRTIAEQHNHDLDDLLDWYKDDFADLAEKSDQDLQFIVLNYLDNLKLYGRELPEEKFQPHCVKCIDCQHFIRLDHPHLGKCAAGAIQTAPAGFWDTHLRGCGKFIEVTGERK